MEFHIDLRNSASMFVVTNATKKDEETVIMVVFLCFSFIFRARPWIMVVKFFEESFRDKISEKERWLLL